MKFIEVTLLNTGLPCFIGKDEIVAFHELNLSDGFDTNHCVITLRNGNNFTTKEEFLIVKDLITPPPPPPSKPVDLSGLRR